MNLPALRLSMNWMMPLQLLESAKFAFHISKEEYSRG